MVYQLLGGGDSYEIQRELYTRANHRSLIDELHLLTVRPNLRHPETLYP